MQAIALLMCHTHYTLTQPETLGLIDNTLPNKKLKTNVMDVHCILIAIFNGKQARQASSLLTKIEVKQATDKTSTYIIFTCIHSEAPQSMAASVWPLVAAYPA